MQQKVEWENVNLAVSIKRAIWAIERHQKLSIYHPAMAISQSSSSSTPFSLSLPFKDSSFFCCCYCHMHIKFLFMYENKEKNPREASTKWTVTNCQTSHKFVMKILEIRRFYLFFSLLGSKVICGITWMLPF